MSKYKMGETPEELRAKQTINESFKKFWSFIKKLSGVIFGLAILGLGVYAAYIGKYDSTLLIKQVALIVSGSCAIVNGFWVLYKTLEK